MVNEVIDEARAFFATNMGGGELSKHVQARPSDEQLAWERLSVSAVSPGPVINNEVLCRQIVSPVHFDADANEIRPNLFEDVIGKGASTHRRSYISDERLVEIAQDRVAQQNLNPPKTGPRTLIGYVSIEAAAVRTLRVDVEALREQQVLAVYDTGNAKDPSHADICLLRRQKQAELSVKSQLYEKAKGTLKRLA